MSYPYQQIPSFNSPLGSQEDIEMNQAILNSLRPTNAGNTQIPQSTWNNTQFIPVQTTTTFVPFPNQQNNIPMMSNNRPPVPFNNTLSPTIPLINRNTNLPPIQTNINRRPLSPNNTNYSQGPRSPIIPPLSSFQQNKNNNQFLTETTKPVMPIIPNLSKGTNSIPIPIPKRDNTYIPYDIKQNTSPRSPGRMSQEEENQMRMAIMSSFQDLNKNNNNNNNNNIPPIISSPPRNPLLSPEVDDSDDIENALLQEAIRMSIEAAEHARVANYHANQLVSSPPKPQTYLMPTVSPRLSLINQNTQLIDEQNKEFEESLRLDRERENAARKAAEAATKAAAASEEAAKILQMAKVAEEAKQESIKPPILQFPIETGNANDILSLRFRLPTGSVITHSFNKNEPLRSLITQIRFDTKHLGDFILTIHPRNVIECSPETSLTDCGVTNRVLIVVSYQDQ